MSGSPNASVLPLPVYACPMTSRPSSSGGMAAAWMGVGISICIAFRARLLSGRSGSSLNEDKPVPFVREFLLDDQCD
jgi:hypothetical protein